MLELTNVTEQQVIEIVNTAGQTLWQYLKYAIAGVLLVLAVKSYAGNMWARISMFLSQEEGTRKNDTVEKHGKVYQIEYISWFKGKVKFFNPDEPTDEILQDLQQYWKSEIIIRRCKRKQPKAK